MSAEPLPILRTGWEPDTPADDTLLRRGVLALSAAWEAIGQVGHGRVQREDRYSAVDLGRPTGLFNSATLLQPTRDDRSEAIVERIEHFYDTQGTGSALLWSPLPTPDLTGRGWDLQGHPPLLYRPAGVPVEPRQPDGRTVAEVTTERDLAAWCAVASDGFPLTDVDTPGTLVDPAVVSDDSRPILIGRFGFLPIARFTLWERPRH